MSDVWTVRARLTERFQIYYADGAWRIIVPMRYLRGRETGRYHRPTFAAIRRFVWLYYGRYRASV